jgi:hypothetical protein
MKTTREHSRALAWTAFSLSAFIRHNTRWRRLAVLILVLTAVHIQLCVPAARAESPAERKNGGPQQWSLRVDKVDTGDVSLDPHFESALLKNLLRELAKTKRFKRVLLGSDNAREVPDLLILKMAVQEDPPSSVTGRATLADAGLLGGVAELFLRFWGRTPVSRGTKLNARVQLYTRAGQLILDNVAEVDVGFIGDNSRATHDLAHNVAVTLKRSTLPDPAIIALEQETARMSKYQVGTITAAQCHPAVDADTSVASCEVSLSVGDTAYLGRGVKLRPSGRRGSRSAIRRPPRPSGQMTRLV